MRYIERNSRDLQRFADMPDTRYTDPAALKGRFFGGGEGKKSREPSR